MRGGGRTTTGLNADRGKMVKPKPGAPAGGYGGTDQLMKRTNAMAQFRMKAARLQKAAIEQSWHGSRPPSEWPAIRKELAEARADLEAFVKSLLPKEPEA